MVEVTYQYLYLAAECKSTKLYFAGNGSCPYYVIFATLTQGDKSVAVECLGQTFFEVPASGRWSDIINISNSGFMPGYAEFSVFSTGCKPCQRIDTEKLTTFGPISRIETSNYHTAADPATLGEWTVDASSGSTATISDGYRLYVEEAYQVGKSVVLYKSISDLSSNFTVEIDLLVDKFGGELKWNSADDFDGSWVYFQFSAPKEIWEGAYADFGVCFAKNEPVVNPYQKYPSDTTVLVVASEGVEEHWKFDFNFTSATSFILSIYKNDVFYKQEAEREVVCSPGNIEETSLYFGANNSSISTAVGYTEVHLTSLKIDTPGVGNIISSGNDVVEITQNGIITVACQPSAGETLTITIDDRIYTFTFVNSPTGSGYDILIGSDTTQTAANIATALSSLSGALISATSSGNVVTVKVYSSNPVTASTNSSGITIGAFNEEILYYSNDAVATLPALTVYGEATQRGILGDIYGLLTFPRMFSEGSATRSKNTGDTYLPLMTSTGQVFKSTGSSSSTDAEKKALLLCDNDWMETFASMVIAPGTWDEIALQAVKWVADFITYTTDTGLDNWKDPVHTLYDGYGDCEDMAILTYSLIRNMGIPYNNIRVYIGETFGVGHAWVMYRRPSDNQWVTLDGTAGSTYWDTITSVDSLTPLYNSVLAIQEESLDSDDYAYGSATEYVTCSDVVTLANGRQYSDSLESSPYLATLAGSFPSLLFNAYGGGYIIRNFPSLLFSATGILSPAAALKVSFPALQFTAIATQNAIASINSIIPALQFSASGIISSIISLSATLPSLIFKATGLVGDSARITGSLPSLKFTATAYWTGSNTIDIDIPCILFNALAHNSVILDADGRKITGGLALVMNTRNLSMTEYDNYGYNSLFEFNGKIFGTTSAGIHELTGDTDTGNPISWHFKIGKIDLEKNIKTKARVAWLSYRPSGDLMLTIDDGENQYEYDVESYKQIDNAVRIKLGKGLRNRFIQMELRNVNGESIVFDHLRLFSDQTKKKR